MKTCWFQTLCYDTSNCWRVYFRLFLFSLFFLSVCRLMFLPGFARKKNHVLFRPSARLPEFRFLVLLELCPSATLRTTGKECPWGKFPLEAGNVVFIFHHLWMLMLTTWTLMFRVMFSPIGFFFGSFKCWQKKEITCFKNCYNDMCTTWKCIYFSFSRWSTCCLSRSARLPDFLVLLSSVLFKITHFMLRFCEVYSNHHFSLTWVFKQEFLLYFGFDLSFDFHSSTAMFCRHDYSVN